MRKIIAFILALLMVMSFTACESESGDTGESLSEETEELSVEEQIIRILNITKVNSSFQQTIGQMIPTVFYNYEIEYYPYMIDQNQYIVIISGDYNPSPEIANLSANGSVRFILDLDSDYCEVNYDPDFIMGTFLAYIVN